MGIYTGRSTVSDAINVLQETGHRATDIAVPWTDNQGSKDFAHEKRTKALEDAATGAAAGAMVGAALAWFLRVQTVTITGFGPLIAAGPLLAALAGAGACGGVGWIVGLLAGVRMPEYIAKRYAGRIRRGGILLSVPLDGREWCDRAKKTPRDTGARHISSASEAAADYGTTDKPTERAPMTLTDRIEVPGPQTVEDFAQKNKQYEAQL